jgi:predicted HicB family RNase H-like nuclease
MLEEDQLTQKAYQTALDTYRSNPDWVTFFREILGMNGIVRRLFPDDRALAAFEKTIQFAEIQVMLARLRQGSATSRDEYEEPTRMITVRLPKSLHESLRAEAHLYQTSMNKLCITKLLQIVDEEINPRDPQRWTPPGTEDLPNVNVEKEPPREP